MFLQQNSLQHSMTYSIMLTKYAENYLNLGCKSNQFENFPHRKNTSNISAIYWISPHTNFWGPTSRPHTEDLVMSLFFYLGVHSSWLGMAQKWSKFHETMANFAIILPLMASYGSVRSYLPEFSARDDLVKVSWKLDARKCQNQPTPPFFDQLNESSQPLSP